MKKAPPSLQVPSIHFEIGSIPKPPIHNETVTIEKNRIYIGNWKIPFSALSKACIEDIETILKNNDPDNHPDYDYPLVFDGMFVLEAKDNSKVFECRFPSLDQGRAKTPSDIRQKDSILGFLRKLVKLYDKWEYKQTEKQRKKEEQEEEEHFQKSNGRKRQTYGKRSTLSKSPYFAGSSIHPSPQDDREVDAFLDRKFAAPKQKSKRVRMLEKAVRRNYFSSDDENETEPIETAQEDPIVKEEIDDAEDMESSPSNNEKKRSLLSVGSRLKKKMRAEDKDNDDDSDFEFDEPSVAKKSQSIKVSLLEDEDEDDDKKIEKDEGKDATTLLTNEESQTKAPAKVTPLRTSTQNSEDTDKKENIEDAITDEEDVPDMEDTAVSSPQAEEKMGNISSFFQAKPNANDTRSKTRSTPTKIKKILKKSKFQERRSTENRTSFADNILQSTPTRKSNPLKLNRSPDSLQSPRKILTKSFDRASDSRRISFSPRISNPYKSTSSFSKSTYSHHKGLRNLGNTCYLNASLQVLFSLPDFLQDLGKIYSKIKAKSEDTTVESLIPICSAMLVIGQKLGLVSDLPGIESSALSSADPSILKKEIDKKLPDFKGYQQQDAQEFATRFIDILHEELVNATKETGTEVQNLPTSQFNLVTKKTRKCDSCESTYSCQETFNCLALEVHGHDMSDDEWSVSQGFAKYFSTEKIENFQCEECNNSTSCTMCTTIVSRPKALLVQLKRFAYDNDQMQKRSEKVALTKDISLEKFVDGQTVEENKSSFMYSLTGVVFHKGRTPFSGHYTADALRRSTNSQEKEWVNFNDLATAKSSFEHVNNEISQTNNYLVIYNRV